MRTAEVVQAWGRILRGMPPSLSIEITRECPLRCPGCYAYGDEHLGISGVTLRQLADRKGDELVQGVLAVVDRIRPLHLSLVGGDPLVRYRELEKLLPELMDRGIHVQIVTSAFREIPAHWKSLPKLNVVVSIDGLEPEHDIRRKPATYARILRNIEAAAITVHCTVTGQMMKRPGYLAEFVKFWSDRPQVRKIWFSTFTPQIGEQLPEILTPQERDAFVQDVMTLRQLFPKLDMPEGMVKEFHHPPASPADCIFAQTTETISADLRTKITPCQYGGKPDCGQCGCIASMGLAAVGSYKLGGVIPVGSIFRQSAKIGSVVRGRREKRNPSQPSEPLLNVIG